MGAIVFLVLISAIFIYSCLDRWCEHKERIAGVLPEVKDEEELDRAA